MKGSGHPIVDTIGKYYFEGNVIPNTWYQTLKKDNGKPDLNAMFLLSDIVYWYRPTVERDEETGLIKEVKKKFKSDLLQRSYKQIEEQFGLTMKQAKETLVRLENKNVIKRVFRTVDTQQGRLPNIMFIELIVEGLLEITFPQSTDVCTKKDGYPSKKVQIPVPKRTDITEITTNIKEEEEVTVQVADTYKFFEGNGFGTIGSHIGERIGEWCDDLSPAIVLEAMKIAVEHGAKNWSYVERILRDWADHKLDTVEKVRAAVRAFKEKRASPKKPGPNKTKVRKEDFNLND